MRRQKGQIALLFFLAAFPFCAAAKVSAEMAAKIKALVKAEIQRQMTGTGLPGSADATTNFSGQLDEFNARIATMGTSSRMYNGFRWKRYAMKMMSHRSEIASACCPLSPPTIL